MEEHIKHLKYLALRLRRDGLIILGTTAANIFTLVLLFLIYYLNQKLFASGNQNSYYYVNDLKNVLTFILFLSSTILLFAFISLYGFEQTKKQVNIIADEIFDEVGWYSRDHGRENKRTSSIEKTISIDDRIVIKMASESTNLPFLAAGQSAVYYVFFNFILFFMTSFTNLYLIQLLTHANQ